VNTASPQRIRCAELPSPRAFLFIFLSLLHFLPHRTAAGTGTRPSPFPFGSHCINILSASALGFGHAFGDDRIPRRPCHPAGPAPWPKRPRGKHPLQRNVNAHVRIKILFRIHQLQQIMKN